ncbi:autotransporter outer membrane beta-barrel domain-containing protein [Bradyrhizobium lablabi]|uniref:autotransporter family protein n=1 Tax=Bradyrhizobium lablabi TaxID=722472 RepID=UPI001FCD4E73|nr:autotransporter outer membrane beta-barrel domain-containing protein [Bradyrhizobium lablabi]
MLALCGAGSPIDIAKAQCSISSSYNGTFVQPGVGSCTITPGTTLGASPFGFYPAPYTGPVSINAGAGDQITANGITIFWVNGQGIGGLARNGGVLIFGGGSTINEGINGGGGNTGLVADGLNSQIIATGLAVNMGGAGNNVGANAVNGGTITLNSGTAVSFLQGGGGNTGLLASGAGSRIITNDATVIIPLVGGSGGNDTGARAEGGAAITLNGGAVTLQGNGGGETGLLATGSGSSISGTGVAVNVSSNGGNARGGFLQNGATIDLTGGSVTTSGGAGSYGFLLQAPAGVTNALGLDGTIVSSASDAFAVQGGGAAINAVDATVTSNNGILLSAVQNATVTMSSNHSVLTGAIFTDNTSTSNVTLAGGTIWNMTGSSNVTNLVNNDSDIIVTAPVSSTAFKTLTVVNYTGTGGTITLNTFLGADNSPSDRLIVNGGTATGSTNLRIQNANGPGYQTVADGILVVNTTNGGATTPGAFTLAGEVRGGAYDYFLFRGGLSGNAPDNWFLRSSFDVPPIPPTPEVPPPILPPDPPPSTLPPGIYPIIGPELATYGVVQPVARQLGLATLGTLNQRIGDTMTLANAGTDAAGWGRSDWGRLFGRQVNDHYQAFADPRADGWIGGLQGGVDLWRANWLSGHRDAAGVYFAYGQANVNVNGLVTNAAATGYVLTHTGTLSLDAFSAGAYWTHYGPSGWYLDAVLQRTSYGGNATTQFAQLPTNGVGFISSLEAGYPIPLPLGPHFVLEPQAQIIWQKVSFNDANDGLGTVGLGATSGPTGRLGVRGQWTIDSNNGIVWQPYVGVNFWRSWGTKAATTFSAIDQVQLIESTTRTEVLGGVTAKLNNRLSFYAQGGYQFVIDRSNNGNRSGAQGNIGLRYTW